MRRVSRTGGCALAILLVLTLPRDAGCGVLNVSQCYQEQTQWCWAGSCQAVLEFYGLTVTQTRIANYATGGNNVWNYLWGAGDPGDGIYRRGCNLVLTNFGGVLSTGFTGLMSLSQLQSEIDAARPVIINWAWDGGGGHILVARGVVASNVYLMDPWYGPSVSDYAWVCRGSSHTWQWTLKVTSSSTTTSGVPRWWMGRYSLTNGWQWDALALGDPDKDGVRTWQEYVADTVPTSGASRLYMSIAASGGCEAVTWPTSTNRQYTVVRGTTLPDSAAWTNVAGLTDVVGTGFPMGYTNAGAGGAEYLRVRVSLRP